LRRWLAPAGRRLALAAVLVGLTGAAAALADASRRDRARRAGAAEALAAEAAGLDQALRNERMLPPHDLRPATAATRARLAALEAESANLAPDLRGPLDLVLGRAAWAVRDPARARDRLEAAWSAGCRTPDAALALAQVGAWTLEGRRAEAAFLGQPPPPVPDGLADRVERARAETSRPAEYVRALAAALDNDDARAARAARSALAANPWHLESAVLASASLSRLARSRLDAGDPEGAAGRYREALEVVRDTLPRGQSEPRLHHAAFAAALGLAALALDRGDLSARAVADLERRADLGLGLDPDDPEAQSDRLQAGALRAMRLLALGQDPREALDECLRFYWTRTREPRGPALRADHMVLYWLQAERDFAWGEDPGPSLAEALKDPGHTPDRARDFLGDLLNLKLRVDAARGQDPRPGAEALAARLAPPAGRAAPAGLGLALARAWLTCAEWELGHRLDPRDSLRQARTRLQRVLAERPDWVAARDLARLARTLAVRARPFGEMPALADLDG
jgi:hypothetical protein